MSRALIIMMVGVGAAACEPRVTFDREAIAASRLGLELPPSFILGVATAAHQIEGGNTNNNWYDFESTTQPDGRPSVPGPSGRAADSWNRWREDHDAVEALALNTYRFSVEWSRIEPAEGVFDEAAVAAYRAQLDSLAQRGIRPVVTLSHFTIPRWVAAHGGWEWDGLYDAVARFSEKVASEYGDRVDIYITVNEPNGVAVGGYAAGVWPPGVRDLGRAWRVYANTLKVHAAIAWALRAADTVDADGDGRATFIGIAHNVTVFQAGSGSVLDSAFAAVADDVFNEMVPRALKTGHISFAIPGSAPVDERVPRLVDSIDFLGIQHYRRDMLRADLLAGGYRSQTPHGGPTADSEFQVFPEGLYRTLMRFAAYGWPLFVTENGVAGTDDTFRQWAIVAHLYAVNEAIKDGAPVLGYLHWTLMDNWEWALGTRARYGLYEVDFDDPALPRRPRPSAGVLREIALDLKGRAGR